MSDQGSNALEGQILGTKYLVRRLIGQGGMGAVYEVEHVLTKRTGALKLLHQSYASVTSVVERFLREASAAGRIGNPHIVETYDAGALPSGEPYIFMELLTGSAVRTLIEQRGRLSFDEAREIALQVAEGLAAAHAVGIVHRDIKPENLFMCDGASAFVKVLDFGISKFAEQHNVARLTEHGSPLGTPHYMSPEQVVSKRDIDGRVDVYALGVVFYECLTGCVPFDAETLPALSIKIFEGQYPAASLLVKELPAGVDQVLARAMARDPGQRFASMLELHAALSALAVRGAELGARTLASASSAQAVAGTSLPPRPSLSELRLEPVTGDSSARAATKRPQLRRVGVPLLLGLPLAGAAAFLLSKALVREQAPSNDPASQAQSPAAAAEQPGSPPARADAQPSASVEPAATVTASSPPASSVQPPRTRQEPLPPTPALSPSRSPRSRAATDGLIERNPFAD
jgi:serine/threonine protein kinase